MKLTNLFKQKNIGRYWGRFALAGAQVSGFISIIILCFTAISAYIPVSQWLMQFGIYIQFWLFIVVILGGMVLLYLFSWGYLVRSFYSSSNEQFWKNDNPIRTEITLLKEENEKLKKIIISGFTDVNKRLDKLEVK